VRCCCCHKLQVLRIKSRHACLRLCFSVRKLLLLLYACCG
jgi:hypothetical protein